MFFSLLVELCGICPLNKFDSWNTKIIKEQTTDMAEPRGAQSQSKKAFLLYFL